MFVTVTLMLQTVTTTSAASVHGETSPDASSAEQFWQSVDQQDAYTPTISLEWLIDDDIQKPVTPRHQRLRSRTLQNTKAKKKDHADDYHWPAETTERHRMLIRCKAEQNQDDCLSELLLRQRSLSVQNSGNIKVIHNLKAIHAISIEVDSPTRDALFSDDFELHRDFERSPLATMEERLEGNEQRNLQQGQSIPWGLQTIRAMQVWDAFGVRGNGVKVCLLDTGVDPSHEDLLGLSMDGYHGAEAMSPWSEDRRGHGTHISGIMGATDNDFGIV
jgi:subtilisin family serine protease